MLEVESVLRISVNAISIHNEERGQGRVAFTHEFSDVAARRIDAVDRRLRGKTGSGREF